MPKIRVTCPTCATPLELDAEYAGQEVQCGSCHQVFVATEDRRSRYRDDDEDRPGRRRRSRREADDDDFDDDRPRRRRRRAASGGGSGAGTASLILGLFAVVAWCCPLIGFPVTVIGLILGFVGLKAENKGTAVAGLVLNGLFFVATLVNAAAGAAMNVANWNNRNRNPFQQQQNPPPRQFRG
jgi:hypothetical protein